MLLRAPIKIIHAVHTLTIIVRCLCRSIIIRRSQLSHNNTCSSAVHKVSQYLYNNIVVMSDDNNTYKLAIVWRRSKGVDMRYKYPSLC